MQLPVSDLGIKAVIPILSIAAGGTGIYGLTAKPSDPMPQFFSFKESGIAPAKDTIGKHYVSLLVAPFELEDRPAIKLSDGWNWSYERWLIDLSKNKSMDRLFQNKESITNGYASEENRSVSKSLNKVCKTAFTLEITEFNNRPHLENNIWNYCSFLLVKPFTIESKLEHILIYEPNTIGGGDYKSMLLSVTNDKVNDKVGELKNIEFQGLNGTIKEKFFAESKNNKEHIKYACSRAYKLFSDATNSSHSPNVTNNTDVHKFCSLSSLNP